MEGVACWSNAAAKLPSTRRLRGRYGLAGRSRLYVDVVREWAPRRLPDRDDDHRQGPTQGGGDRAMGLAGHMAAELGSIFRGLVEAFPPNHLHDAMGGSLPAWILPADARVELRIGGRPGTVPTGRCSRDPGCGSPSGATIGTGPDGPRTAPPSGSMPSDPGKVGPTSAKSSGGEWTVSAPMRGILNGSLGHLLSCILRSYCPAVPPRCRCTSCRLSDPSGRPGWTRPAETRPAWRTPPSASTRSGPPSPPAPSPSSSLTWLVGRTRPAPWYRPLVALQGLDQSGGRWQPPLSMSDVRHAGRPRPAAGSGTSARVRPVAANLAIRAPSRSCVQDGDGQPAARAQTLPREGKRKPLLAGRDGAAAPDADDQRRGKRRAIGFAAGAASPPRSSVSSPPNSTTFG